MVAVSANSQSSQYSYDSLGHVTQISAPQATNQLAAFSFMPTHGEAGTEVTIQGQGFDPVAVNDTVSFNGVVTAVSSATTSQLSVTVPAGASSGPLTIQADSHVATTSAAFVVDGTGLPPVINAIAPRAVTAGSTLTISGANFEPVGATPGTDMSGTPLFASSISDSKIQVPIPSKVVTGYVRVSTPYGWAKSSYPVVVPPAAVPAASVASVASLTASSPSISETVGSAGQYGLVTFEGSSGAWMSLQLSNIVTSASNLSYSIYSPSNVLIQQGTVSSATPSIHLPQLTTSGIYLAVFRPDTAGAQFSISSELDKIVSSAILPVATITPGQSERLIIPAALNQSVTTDVATVATIPSGQAISYTIYSPTGQLLTSTVTSSTGQLPIPVPVAGNYQLIVSAGAGGVGSSFVSLVNGVSVTTGETPTDFSGYAAGQAANVKFTAHANDNLEVLVDNLRVSFNDRVTINILDDSGTNIASGTCTGPTAECRLPAWSLVGGTYTLQVVPGGNDAVSFNATVLPDIVGPQLVARVPTAFTLNNGEVQRLTFAVNAGDSFSLQLSDLGTTPTGQPLQVAIYSPASAIRPNTALVSNSFSSDGTLEISNAPVTGTYTVIVSTSGLPAVAQLTLVPAMVSDAGQSVTYGGYLGGQVADVTFKANAGDNLEVLIDGLQVSFNDRVSVNILDASGTNIASGTCTGPASECRLPAWNLVGGVYTIKVAPGGNDAINSLNVTVQPDVVGPALVTNTSTGVTLTSGEVERLTFSARAGDNIGLKVAGLATTPTGQPLLLSVYGPGATILPTTALIGNSYSSEGVLHLSNLASTGTYTVVVSTSGVPATAQLTLVSTTASDESQTTTYRGYLGGQTAGVTFSANAGDNLEVLIDGLQVSFNDRVSIGILDASGTSIASGTCTGPTSECRLPAWNLAGGTYAIKVVPSGNDAINSFNVTIQPDVVGRVLVANTPFGVSLANGKVERLTFSAHAGDNIGLKLAELATTPVGQPLQLAVYGPGATILPSTPLISNSYAGAGILQLSNLPSTGTYTVIVSTTGVPAVAQLTLVSTTTSDTGQSTTYRGYLGGQTAAVTFNANVGDNLEVLIDGLQVSFNDRVSIGILDANGTSIASGTCTGPASECRLPAWNLGGGTYTIKVVPGGNDAINSFNVTVQPDVLGPTLAHGVASEVALNKGQVERLTFDGSAGETLFVNVTGLATTPNGQALQLAIYDPDGSILTNNAILTKSALSDGNVPLGNLPKSGTYTMVVSTAGAPAIAALTLESGAGTGTTSPPTATSPTQTFPANAGDNLEVLVDHLQVTNSDSVTINVIDPSGTTIASSSCQGSTSECRLPAWNLVGGTYTVQVVPSSSSDVLSNFTVTVQPDVLGPSLAADVASTLTLGKGQVERVSVNANVGDNVVFDLHGLVTTPQGQSIHVALYSPTRGIVPTNALLANSYSGDGQLQLSNVPVAGTYTVVVSTTGVPATLQITPRWESVGANGQTGSFGNYQAGQTAYVPFTANAGDNLEVLVDNLQNTNNDPVTINLIDPAGTNIASGTCQGSTAECRLPAWNLQGAKYTIQIVPYQGSDALSNFNVTVQPDLAGPILVANATSTLTLNKGQVERVSFTANAGDNVLLDVAGLSTTPGDQAIQLAVYNPTRGILTTNAQISQSFTSSGQLQISNIPTTGTYTVVVSTTGVPGTLQITPRWESVGTNGQTGSFGNYQAGQAAYVPFKAGAGDNLEVLIDNLQNTNNDAVTINLIDPTGTNIASSTCQGSTAECRVPAWNAQAGIYTIQVVPYQRTDALSSFSVTVQPDVLGPTLTASTSTTLTLNKGQVQRVSFSANAGDNVLLDVAGLMTTPGGQAVQLAVYNPTRGILTTNAQISQSFTSNGQLQISNIPVAGAYTVVVSTTGVPATLQITPRWESVATNGQAGSFGNYQAGQVAYVPFTANAGDNLEVLIDNLQTTGNDPVTINVIDPTGTNIASSTCQGSTAECRLSAWNAPAGTYTIQVVPSRSTDVLSDFSVTVQPDVVGPALVADIPSTVALTKGQVERVTFTAKAGDNVTLDVAALTTSPPGQAVQLSVYSPTRTILTTDAVASGSFAVNGQLLVNRVPASGTYTLVVSTGGVPATLLVAVTSSNGSGNGQPVTYPSHNFNANKGDNLEVLVDHLQVSFNDPVTVNVVDVNGTKISTGTCQGSTSECRFPAWNLAGGTYTVQVIPSGSDTVTFSTTIQADTIGPQLANNTASTISLANGQVERLTFTAAAGSNLSFSLAGIVTTPTGQPIQVAIYGPNKAIWPTGALVGSSFTGNAELELSNAPTTGTYTMVISTSGLPATAQVTMVPATVATNDQAASYTGYLGGQVAQSTFTANAGDNLEVLIDKLQVSFNDRVTINIVDANGTNLASGTCTGPTSECRLPAWNLVGGTYAIQIVPSGNDAINSYSATVQPDITGPQLANNVASTVTLANGQVERLTFTAAAGSNLSFSLAGIVTTPTGQPIQVAIYGPNKAIWPTGALVGSSFTGNAELELSNAPTTGTYTMVISTSGLPATAQVTMVPATVATNDQAASYTGYLGGQVAQSTFTANAGDNLEVLIDKLQVSFNDRVTINIVDANGTNLASGTCTGPTSECRLPVWNLVGGTYAIQIVPSGNDAINSYSAKVQPDITGPQLANNVASTVTLANGQVERLTFTAAAGSNLSFSLAGIVTTPTGQPIQVAIYGPNKAIWPTGALVGNSFTGNAELELSNAPTTGTYTMVISTSGLPATAQVTMVPVTVETNGQSATYTGYLGGQMAQATFTANAGDNLEVLIDKLQVSFNDRVTINIIDANGVNLASGTCTGPTSECRIPAWNLVGGTYTVQIIPGGNDAINSYNISVQPDIPAAPFSIGNPTSVTLSAGQVGRTSFTVEQGGSLQLSLGGASGGGLVYADVYGISPGPITPNSHLWHVSTSGSSNVSLGNLSSGTYQVVVYTDGSKQNAQLGLYMVVAN
jgi:anti-sigma factor ChrR (cupin superfamily)